MASYLKLSLLLYVALRSHWYQYMYSTSNTSTTSAAFLAAAFVTAYHLTRHVLGHRYIHCRKSIIIYCTPSVQEQMNIWVMGAAADARFGPL